MITNKKEYTHACNSYNYCEVFKIMKVSFTSQQADEREQKARDYMRAEVGYAGECKSYMYTIVKNNGKK